MHNRLTMLFPIIVAFGCAADTDTGQVAEKASTDNPAVQQAIDQVNADFAEGLKTGDAARLLAHYDADATVLPDGAPAAHGAAEIEKALAGFLAEVTITEFQLTTTDLTVKDNMAIETGTTRSVMQPKQGGGPPVTDVGKYVVVWKKQTDGSWKLWRDIFNSDASPAPAK